MEEFYFDFLCDRYTSNELAKIKSGNKIKGTIKMDIARELAKFYNNLENLKIFINSFDKIYKDVLELSLNNLGELPDIDYFNQKYHTNYKYLSSLTTTAPLNLFLFDKTLFNLLYDTLRKIIPYEKVNYIEYKNPSNIYKNHFPTEYASSILKIINTKILTVKTDNQLNKTSATRLIKGLNLKLPYEFNLESIYCNSIINIFTSTKIIKIVNSTLKLKDFSYYEKSLSEKLTFLYESYINSKTINEIKLLTTGAYEFDKYINFTPLREGIVDILKDFPVDKWISFESLVENFVRKYGHIYSKCIGIVYKRSTYDYGYYFHGTLKDMIELLSNIICINFLSALGLIDISYDFTDYYDDFGQDFKTVKLNAVRLTKTGYNIFNDIKEESFENNKSRIIINSDFEIEITEGSDQEYHELYFDKFLTKEKRNKSTIYKLNFEGICKALDLNISLEDLYSHLNSISLSVLPDEVINKFFEYKQALSKTTIKTVTIIETTDEEILNDLKKSSLVQKEITNAFVIETSDINKVKKMLERKKKFVKIIK